MNTSTELDRERGKNITIYSILGTFIFLLTLMIAATFPFRSERKNFSARAHHAEILESSLALKEAGDGDYLVYAFLRGDQVLYDDNGHAVVLLQERRKGKDGQTHYNTIFQAGQFYLDDIPLPELQYSALYYPNFDSQYGTNSYRGLFHCQQGTFLVAKEGDTCQDARFYPGKQPAAVIESIGDGTGGKVFWFGQLALDLLCIALLTLRIRRSGIYVCPRCGRRMKKDEWCPTCMETAVPWRKVRGKAESDAAAQTPKPAPKPMTSQETKKLKRDILWGVLAVVLVVVLLVGDVKRDQRIASSGISETYAYRPIVPEDVYRGDPYAYIHDEGYGQYRYDGGKSVELPLSCGYYIVGVHIPAGVYTVETEDDFDTLIVTDYGNRVYLYEYAAKEGNHLNDVRLYHGALVEIQTGTKMTLRCEHARTADLYSIANPLTEAVVLRKNGRETAGADFAPGIYDLTFAPGEYTVRITVDDAHSGEDIIHSFECSGDEGGLWKNMVLPEGAEIEITDGTLTLIPSPDIFSTCYTAYYEIFR